MLLVSGRVSVPKPLSQIQRSTRWLLQGLSPRTSFGGFGLTLRGLEPWQAVDVEFIDPLAQPAEWINDSEVRLVIQDGSILTQRKLYADGDGEVSWVRIATQDTEGEWSMLITMDGRTITVSYSIRQLQLPVEVETVGVDLRRYQGVVTDTYYSALVPATLAVDLQGSLISVLDQLQQRLGLQSRQIPNIYLLGNRTIFEQVAAADGVDVGPEDGHYRDFGARPGIYMRNDFLHSALRRLLTHEYLHLVLQEEAGGSELPAWINEGLARFYEYELALDGQRANATKVPLYYEIDLVKSAAISDTLVPLTTLKSLSDWNSRLGTETGEFQYAEAQMAVRYSMETCGNEAPLELVRAIGRGSPLILAMIEVTGIQYSQFRQEFAQWVESWEDPERVAVRGYLNFLDSIADSADQITVRREADLTSGASQFTRLTAKRNFVTEASVVLADLEELSPPDALAGLHLDASTYLTSFVRWLTLEMNYFETFNDATLGLANDMIPEINVRELLLLRDIGSAKFVYNILE